MRPLLLCIAFLLAAPGPARADSMRCGDHIVGDEATAAEVLGTCGPPAYRDAWHGSDFDEEVWTYNFGSNQLLQAVHLRAGKVSRIDSDGYGFEPEPPRACHPIDLVDGLSKYRLVTLCGPPLTRESYGTLRPLRRRDGRIVNGSLLPVYREKWVYDFGPQYLLQIVTLENGRVTDVESGARGRATPRD